jgi:hypothetical protein
MRHGLYLAYRFLRSLRSVGMTTFFWGFAMRHGLYLAYRFLRSLRSVGMTTVQVAALRSVGMTTFFGMHTMKIITSHPNNKQP